MKKFNNLEKDIIFLKIFQEIKSNQIMYGNLDQKNFLTYF